MNTIACPTCKKPVQLPATPLKIGKCTACGEAFELPKAPQKICSACGLDVSQQKRTKDTQGHYFCQPCWDKRSAAVVKCPASKLDLPVTPGSGLQLLKPPSVHATVAQRPDISGDDDPFTAQADLAEPIQATNEMLRCPECGGMFGVSLMHMSGICKNCDRHRRTIRRTIPSLRMSFIAAGGLVIVLIAGGAFYFFSTHALNRAPVSVPAPGTIPVPDGEAQIIRSLITEYARACYQYNEAKDVQEQKMRVQEESAQRMNFGDVASVKLHTAKTLDASAAVAHTMSAQSAMTGAATRLSKYEKPKVKSCRDQLLEDQKTPQEYRRYIFEVCENIPEASAPLSSVPPQNTPAVPEVEQSRTAAETAGMAKLYGKWIGTTPAKANLTLIFQREGKLFFTFKPLSGTASEGFAEWKLLSENGGSLTIQRTIGRATQQVSISFNGDDAITYAPQDGHGQTTLMTRQR